MAKYEVTIDISIVVCGSVEIEADDEQEARDKLYWLSESELADAAEFSGAHIDARLEDVRSVKQIEDEDEDIEIPELV